MNISSTTQGFGTYLGQSVKTGVNRKMILPFFFFLLQKDKSFKLLTFPLMKSGCQSMPPSSNKCT